MGKAEKKGSARWLRAGVDRSDCCASCGRAIQKAHKVYLTQRYCPTCYARLFKPRLCPGCGARARLAIFDASAVCDSCGTTGPCIRCGRIGRPVGKLTPYGPACNSCAHYFTEPRQCEVCNRLSTRLVKRCVDGRDLRCCPKCWNTSATCPSCRRCRVLIEGRNGVMECRRCAQVGEANCGTCGNTMPGGYGRECKDCYYRRTFHKRLQINTAALNSDSYHLAYTFYGEWLLKKIGAKRAALLINRHLKSFMEMSTRWPVLPSYRQLVESLGAQWIRRAQLPVQWMIEERGLRVDQELKAEYTELRRIKSIISSMASDAARTLLTDYWKYLESKPNKSRNSLKSVRMALRSAANLLLTSAAVGQALPSSSSLRSLLAETPGIAASLKGFVSYLNARYCLGLEFPKDNRDAIKLKRHRLELEVKALMIESMQGNDVLDRWPAAALGYFHGVTRFRKADVTLTPDAEQTGMIVSLQGEEYWIPMPPEATMSE